MSLLTFVLLFNGMACCEHCILHYKFHVYYRKRLSNDTLPRSYLIDLQFEMVMSYEVTNKLNFNIV